MTDAASVDLFTRLLDWSQSIDLAIGIWLGGSLMLGIGLYVFGRLIIRFLVRRKVSGYRTLRRMRGPVALLALLVFLWLSVPVADFTPGVRQIAEHALLIGLVLLGGWTALLAIGATTAYLARTNRLDVEDNLEARRLHTQMSILKRAGEIVVVLTTTAGVLMTFPAVRHIGLSMFASAGVAGLVLGLAARPILSNLIAGIQIAITQPIRLDDVVIVEGEWGWIEEITATYVVVRVWDLRRLIVPLSHFIEKPFENWTRKNPALIGTVSWHLDFRAPLDEMRATLTELVTDDPAWDRNVASIQVTGSDKTSIEVRALVSARNSSDVWNLRCRVREGMLTWLRNAHPEALPHQRAEILATLPGERRPQSVSAATAEGVAS